MYKGKVIFYSLGNFVVPSSKERKSEGRVHYGVTPDPEYPNYPYPPEARKTAIAKCVISSGRIMRVSYLPALINKAVQPDVVRQQGPRFAEVHGEQQSPEATATRSGFGKGFREPAVNV